MYAQLTVKECWFGGAIRRHFCHIPACAVAGGCSCLVGADLVSARPATEPVIPVGTTALGRPFV